jgi:Domain of unknown function (DUF4157)
MKLFAQGLHPSPLKFPPARSKTTLDSDGRKTQPKQAALGIGFDFTKIPLHAPQAKLEVGPSADAHEKEADQVADEVISTPKSPYASPVLGASSHISPLQLSRAAESTTRVAPPVNLGSALQGPGKALEPHTCAFMESRFGHDFSKVRVHTDSAAAASAKSLNARAYTVGRDIAFAAEYASAVHGGWLLAHELAHVVQQHAGGPVIQCQPEHGPTHEHAKSPTAKASSRTNSLRAKSAEVQAKLEGFTRLKEWRGQFDASTKEELRQIHELSEEWENVNLEWVESLKHWYIFEHESTPWITKRLNQLVLDIGKAYWTTTWASDDEKKYESESRKKEVGLLTEQRAIIAAIGTLDKAGKQPPQSQVDSLMARLNKLSAAVGQLWDEEIRAQLKYTGSGPVSRAQ